MKFFVAVVIVLLLLIYFMVVVLRSVVSEVNQKVNGYFLKHLENYYDHSDFEISTNELFYEPESDFLKQRTWLNVRETLTKEKLMNSGELDNICDQIIEFYQFHKQNNPEIIK